MQQPAPIKQNQRLAIALLVCLVLWCGWQSWLSSQHSRNSAPQPSTQITNADSSERPKPHNDGGWAWITKDAAGFFTLCLVIVGGGQFILFWVQLGFIRESLGDAKKSADAAKEAADAAKISADHIPHVERAYLSGGGAPAQFEPVTKNGRMVGAVHTKFILDINNYGKTPGELLEYGIGWCKFQDVDNLPFLPEYKWHFLRDFIKPDTASRHLSVLDIPLDVRNDPVIYGRFTYRDIFGIPHSDGFIQRGGTPIRIDRVAYTQSDPKWLRRIGYRKPGN